MIRHFLPSIEKAVRVMPGLKTVRLMPTEHLALLALNYAQAPVCWLQAESSCGDKDKNGWHNIQGGRSGPSARHYRKQD
jgi:hypothetical protein